MKWLRKIRVRFSGGGASLTVNPGAETDRQHFVEIQMEKSISGKANDMVIRIHNLAESSRNKIGTEFTTVELEAGYIPPGGPDTTGIIFMGQIRDFEHDRDGPEIVTTVTAGDGDQAIRKSAIAKTYPAGTEPPTVMEDIYLEFKKRGVERGEWLFPPMEPFARPYSVALACSREANTLGRSKGFYWSIQNNVMEIIPSDLFLPLATLVNKDTGMVGIPKLTDNGIRVTTLINPEIRPNRVIKVQSDFVDLNADDGEYRVGRIDYSGDNRGGRFDMVIHAEAIKGGVVDEGAQ